MKKLLFSLFIFTISFLSSANVAMAIDGECLMKNGSIVISAAGKDGDAVFNDGSANISAPFTYADGYTGEFDDNDANHCNTQPLFYKVKFFRAAICMEDPYKGNADPDFTSCADLFNNSADGKEIVITKDGADVSLIDNELSIPMGDYPYLAVVVSNHLRIKHFQKYVYADDSRAVIYGNGDTGTNTNTDLCYTVDKVTTYSGHTYNAPYLTAHQTTHGSAFTIDVSGMGETDAMLECTSNSAPGGDYDYATEIIDHFGDFETGYISFLDYEAQQEGTASEMELSATMLNVDNLTLATHVRDAQRIGAFYKYENPIVISEMTTGIKLKFATTSGVSVDGSQDAGNAKIWAAKVGADPFSIIIETRNRRSRGAWR